MASFDEDFKEANKRVHPVETQWHYPIMIAAGFKPITKSAIGFVRCYHYEHETGWKIKVITGVNADYWEDLTVGNEGYWASLEPHLKNLEFSNVKA